MPDIVFKTFQTLRVTYEEGENWQTYTLGHPPCPTGAVHNCASIMHSANMPS